MASLFWNGEVRELPESIENVVIWRTVVEGGLRRLGYANVRRTTLEVAGGKNGCWVSVAHFPIAGRRFWEVVMGGGDAAEATRATVAEVVRMIRQSPTL